MGKRYNRKARVAKRSSITLSKKHGVNPTIPICFWCGKEKNEIAMLGKLPGDMEAPRSMWIPGDYDPCEECEQNWNKGIRVIEASNAPVLYPEQPSYYGAYPTGNNIILEPNKIEVIFKNVDFDKIREKKMCFMDKSAFTKLLYLRENEEREEKEEKEEDE